MYLYGKGMKCKFLLHCFASNEVWLGKEETCWAVFESDAKLQGGESCDFLQLFCTCIRTERVRKMFIIFLILSEFSCSKVEKPCIYSQRQNI